MLSVVKQFEFEAAHCLPQYSGNCANMHGHSYCVEFEFGGPDDLVDRHNMVVDFKTVKETLDPIIDSFDHRMLNDFMDYPSAENIVRRLVAIVSNTRYGNMLLRVRLWETSTSYAEWRRE